jgi:hypothetical protein
MRPGATAWLMLMRQLMLMLYHASVVLQHKSLVHHPFEVLKVLSLQRIGQPIIQAIQETFLLLIISVNLMRGIAGQLGELSNVLVHSHGLMFQILKLFLLQLDHALGNMMCMESNPEFRPVVALGLLGGFHYRKQGNVHRPKTDEYMFIVDEHNLCSSGNRRT